MNFAMTDVVNMDSSCIIDDKLITVCLQLEVVKFTETEGSITVFHSVEKTGFVSF